MNNGILSPFDVETRPQKQTMAGIRKIRAPEYVRICDQQQGYPRMIFDLVVFNHNQMAERQYRE